MGSSASGRGLEGLIQALSFPLPLDDFYYDLNHSKKNLNKYNEECKRLCSKNESFTDIRLCSILLRFLNNSSTRTNNINSDYDDCILFNYWIYDKLEQKYKNDYSKKFVPIYGDLQAMWNSLIEKPSKNPYYDKSMLHYINNLRHFIHPKIEINGQKFIVNVKVTIQILCYLCLIVIKT
ncbi:hypothetical protein PVMG_06303 [Plasmodium vivax Mauritania I]|uniref:PIR Superfamily Protein n=1 Tax=Plasmodium vivax Mauritania I TaxID=1035515 RepID=A0A0J9T572_PLAVI|nr:hypothetical protein PVMG_06303 [Plasmodium vivax Mauritania I]